jgi:hypothetical protein
MRMFHLLGEMMGELELVRIGIDNNMELPSLIDTEIKIERIPVADNLETNKCQVSLALLGRERRDSGYTFGVATPFSNTVSAKLGDRLKIDATLPADSELAAAIAVFVKLNNGSAFLLTYSAPTDHLSVELDTKDQKGAKRFDDSVLHTGKYHSVAGHRKPTGFDFREGKLGEFSKDKFSVDPSVQIDSDELDWKYRPIIFQSQSEERLRLKYSVIKNAPCKFELRAGAVDKLLSSFPVEFLSPL